MKTLLNGWWMTKGIVSAVLSVPIFMFAQSANANIAKIDPIDYGQIEHYEFYNGGGSVPFTLRDTRDTVTSHSAGNLFADSPSVQKSGDYFLHSAAQALDTRAIVEFGTSALAGANFYYLVLSPWSMYAGNGITDTVNLFNYHGNGVVDLPDWGNGVSFGLFSILPPASGWYTPDLYGGFVADARIDVTTLVNDYLSRGDPFLGFNVTTLLVNNPDPTGVLFRAPYILASSHAIDFSTPPLPVPEPETYAMILEGLGLMGFAARRKKQKSIAA